MFHGFIPRVMGTRLDMLLFDAPRATMEQLWQEFVALATSLDDCLNRFSPTSEVARINAAPTDVWWEVSPLLAELLHLGRDYGLRTEGLFDVTLGQLAALQLEPTRLRKRADLQLDFGGMAKGYLLRRIEKRLREAGVERAFVDFGRSSILGLGSHPYGDCWPVEVENPYDGVLLGRFELRDAALSTSGNTPTYSGHILHPKRGEWCETRRVVVVKAADALDAEVLSTAWMVADVEEQSRLAAAFGTIEPVIYNL